MTVYFNNISHNQIPDGAFCSFCSEDINRGSLRDIAGHTTPSGGIASHIVHSDCLKDVFHKRFGLKCGDCFKWVDISGTLNKGEKSHEPPYRSDGATTIKIKLVNGREGEVKVDGIDTVRQLKNSLRSSYSTFNRMSNFSLCHASRELAEGEELKDCAVTEASTLYAIEKV